MNSKFIDFKGTVSNYSNKTIEQPNNREILEKQRIYTHSSIQINREMMTQATFTFMMKH